MQHVGEKLKRRKTPWVIGTLMIVSLAMLVVLQSTNLWKEFAIESSSDLLLLYALSSLNFIAFVIFGFIFLRSITKLVRERRTFQLGSQIKTRLLIYFFAVSLLPIIAMAVFSYLFMNRALERWFTQIPENVIREARQVQDQALIDRSATLDETARMLAAVFEKNVPDERELATIAEAGNLVHIELLSQTGESGVAYERSISPEERAELDRVLGAARAGNSADPILRDGKGFDVSVVGLTSGRTLIVVPDMFGERTVSQIVENSMLEFDRLKEKQVTVRQVGLLTLGVLTFLLIFASSWIAFYVARGLTAPIRALAEGADEIAKGNLGHRVDVLAEDELALLVGTFNQMSAKLESNSVELSERRKYIETVLETLPTGVISFDEQDRVSTINRAALGILRLDNDDVQTAGLHDLVSHENRTELDRLVKRARRVGHASDQIVLRRGSDATHEPSESEMTVAITATQLPAHGGVVLVIEDLSELISAQRASAWQEVARRMAHEIKNPLTPIQLSAERIAKRFTDGSNNGGTRPVADKALIGEVVNESTATILREVTSLKMMVDEFSRFARLPDIKLAPGVLNEVIMQAVAAFDGRYTNVDIETELAADLPEVSLDCEQLKGVFVNLIQNAVEAIDESTGRPHVMISTRYDPAREIVVSEVADNGRGIAAGDLQKLFQPYFSTKGRGTGLGLAIVNRIISEHRGRINVAANQPHGAKFMIELPVSS